MSQAVAKVAKIGLSYLGGKVVDSVEDAIAAKVQHWLGLDENGRDKGAEDLDDFIERESKLEPNMLKRKAMTDLGGWIRTRQHNDISNHNDMPHAHGNEREEIHELLGYAPMDLDAANNFRRGKRPNNNMANYWRRRRRYGGNRKFKKKYFRSRKKFTRGLKKYVSRLHEPKWIISRYDPSAANMSRDTNWGWMHLNGVGEGSSQSARIGKRIEMTSLELQCILANAGDTQFVRMVVIIMKKPNGVVPQVADIFHENTATISTIGTFFNPLHRSDFILLWDHMFKLDTAADGTQQVYFKKTFNLKGKKAKYDGATGVIGEMVSNGIFMYCWSERALGDGLQPIGHFGFKLNFRDV